MKLEFVEVVMVLGTAYIFVNDFKKSLEFYSKLLQENPLYVNDDRWGQFRIDTNQK